MSVLLASAFAAVGTFGASHPRVLPAPTPPAIVVAQAKRGKGKKKKPEAVAPDAAAAPVGSDPNAAATPGGPAPTGASGPVGASGASPAPPAAPPAATGPKTPPELPKKYRAVALLPIRAFDVDGETTRALEAALLNEIDETKGMQAVAPGDVLADLAASGIDINACGLDVACLANAGRFARAHLIIESRLASLGGTLSISMRLVDTEKGVEAGRVAEPISDDEKSRAQEIHRLAVQLLTPKDYVGTLKLDVAVDGAEVYLDDKLVGTTPLNKPLAKLRAGPHILRISKPGFADLNRFVDVVYKRTSTLRIDLTNTTVAAVIVEEQSTTGFGSLFVATQEPDVEIRVDGEPKDKTLLTAAIDKIAAGNRRVSFRRGSQTFQLETVEIRAGQRTDIKLLAGADGSLMAETLSIVDTNAPLPGPEIISAVDPNHAGRLGGAGGDGTGASWKLLAGVLVAGGGGAALVVSTVYAGIVSNKNDRARQLETDGDQLLSASQRQELEANLSTVNNEGARAQTMQFVFLGVGVGLVSIGGILMLTEILSSASAAGGASTTTTVGIIPTQGGAYGSVGIRF